MLLRSRLPFHFREKRKVNENEQIFAKFRFAKVFVCVKIFVLQKFSRKFSFSQKVSRKVTRKFSRKFIFAKFFHKNLGRSLIKTISFKPKMIIFAKVFATFSFSPKFLHQFSFLRKFVSF
jgi:hypothetical protein